MSTLSHLLPRPLSRPRIGLLRLMTCGSVDDGKSTLLGRLLYDCQQVLDDQLQQLERDSRRYGSAGGEIDYALLLDGLEAEREQGITIDVAYRFATTGQRRLIIADAPGHAQYTRNMATAASVSDLAVLLVDAQQGLLPQTRRHSAIAALMGVRHIVLAVNKMDLVGHDPEVFEAIVREYGHIASQAAFGTRFETVVPIPVSARHGDNIVHRSTVMDWYTGPTLLEHLDGVDVDTAGHGPFRMPVQWVNRPDDHFRGYAGTIASGEVRAGERIVIGKTSSTVGRVITAHGDVDYAQAGQAVTLVLDDELDISRGDVVADAANPVAMSDQFLAHLVWLGDAEMPPGRQALFKIGTRTVSGSITRIHHRVDMDTGHEQHAETLRLNDVAQVQISLMTQVPFTPYHECRDLGGFIMMDRLTNATIGVGMIDQPLQGGANLTWQALDVTRTARADMKAQRPAVLWFTGLSGAGKSTIANLLERRLHAMGRHTYVLDGDNIRHGLCRDLGFSEADRVENIRRVGEVAALFADAGLIVLVSFISPYRAERDMARQLLPNGEFLEVFVDTALEECRRRDPKGLYAKADAGKIENFTGISAPYEEPLKPDIHLRTQDGGPDEMIEQMIAAMRRHQIL